MKIAKTGVLITTGVLVAWAWGFAQQQQTPRNTTVDGATLYKQHCAVCHGTSGKGDGPMAKMLVAKTPDLTRIAERHAGKFPRVEVNQIISGESLLAAGHGTREMPIWGPEFSEVERDIDRGNIRVDNLARYLGTLQGK